MKLELVDQRSGADGTSRFFHGDSWRLLCRLASGVGARDWPVNVVLVDDGTMADLNREYRDHEGVTDVLSFSYLESSGDGTVALPKGAGYAPADVWLSDEPEAAVVGELILAPAFIADRCAKNDWVLAHEYPLLVVHGCLHLLGWDHEDDDERELMQKIESLLLAGEDLPHPLRQRN